MLTKIAIASLKSRRTTVCLTLISIMISVSLLVSVEYIRGQVKQSFTRTVSGVDLIVGAPTGELNLLLYSVFQMGNATGGISWQQLQRLENNTMVDWVVPVSLGDSHKGFRVVGTDNRYFEHYQYGDKQPLKIARGDNLTDTHAAVIGAQVASELNYQVGDKIVISHGLGNVSFHQHDGHPFTVAGILEKTGTPVDKAVHVTLAGIEQIHTQPASRRSLARKPVETDSEHANENEHEHEHEHGKHTSAESGRASHPDEVTALFVGLTNRAAALQLQYQLNQRNPEPVLAILPGMTLSQLWSLMGNIEALLRGISGLILVASLTGLITMMLAGMQARGREIAVFRAMGAGPLTILWLIQAEALLIALAGSVLAVGFNAVLFPVLSDTLSQQYGLFLSGSVLTSQTGIIVLAVLLATWLCSFIPAVAAYRQALQTGLSGR